MRFNSSPATCGAFFFSLKGGWEPPPPLRECAPLTNSTKTSGMALVFEMSIYVSRVLVKLQVACVRLGKNLGQAQFRYSGARALGRRQALFLNHRTGQGQYCLGS
jgi:hypothetical protein